MALVAKPSLKGDFGERGVAFGQRRFSALDPELHQMLVWSRPRRTLELAREMKGAHPRLARQIVQAQVMLVVVGDEGQDTPESLPRQAAREAPHVSPRGCVMPQEVDGQHVRQRLRVESPAGGVRFQLGQQRLPDADDEGVVQGSFCYHFKPAPGGGRAFGGGAQHERRVEIDRDELGLAFERGRERLPRRNHAHAAARLRARVESAGRAYLAAAVFGESDEDEVSPVAVFGHVARAET